MANYFEKKEAHRRELEKYYNEKPNLRLKYAAIASIAIAIILLLINAFGWVGTSTTVQLLLQGCAGLFAIIFVVLVTILVYRANAAHLNNKHTPPAKQHNAIYAVRHIMYLTAGWAKALPVERVDESPNNPLRVAHTPYASKSPRNRRRYASKSPR